MCRGCQQPSPARPGRRAPQVAFGQVKAVGADPFGEAGIGANQEQQPTVSAQGGQVGGEGSTMRGAVVSQQHRRSPGQAARRGDGIGHSGFVGDEDERRKCPSVPR